MFKRIKIVFVHFVQLEEKANAMAQNLIEEEDANNRFFFTVKKKKTGCFDIAFLLVGGPSSVYW